VSALKLTRMYILVSALKRMYEMTYTLKTRASCILHGAICVTLEERCSVLQCVVVCCSVLQCVAVCCSVLQCDMTWSYMCDICVTYI